MSRINSNFKGTTQDAGTEPTHDFVSYQGEPIKRGGQGFSYMGTLEDTMNDVQPPIHRFNDDSTDEEEFHNHTGRDITPG